MGQNQPASSKLRETETANPGIKMDPIGDKENRFRDSLYRLLDFYELWAKDLPLTVCRRNIQRKPDPPKYDIHARFLILPDRVGRSPESSESEMTTAA